MAARSTTGRDFLRDCVAAMRDALPDSCPLFVRLSATDWTEGGWNVEQSIELSRRLKSLGVDVVDCSSGGNIPDAKIPVGPGYQVPFAQRVRKEVAIATAAVGMIFEPAQADQIVRNGEADVVLIARELLRDPYWPLRAARELGTPMSWPAQYLRAAPRDSPERVASHEFD
jgi:2,4-dienoyl-CoA reductase-like NADH-dependent reductase (Old Yellow Enzyme family)